MKNILLAINISIICLGAWGFTNNHTPPSLEEVIRGINIFYAQQESIYQELEYRLYKDHTTQEIHSTEKGVLILSKEVKYSKIGPIESLTTDQLTIGIDHEEQVLMISNIISIESETYDPLSTVADYLQQNNNYTIEQLTPTLEVLHIFVEYGEIESLQIGYDPATYQLDKIELLYRRSIQINLQEEDSWVQPKLVIDYQNTRTDQVNTTLLDTSNYIRKTGNAWQPIAKYNSYEFINNIQTLSNTK